MKNKNLTIELIKFLAVLIVANGHMDILYGKYNLLATGGAIGDALFFFVSGFAIFLGRFDRFDNWYKRRIKRIYPSLIAWAGILSFCDVLQLNLYQIVSGGFYWFLKCIMLYYVVLYMVRLFAEKKPIIPFMLSILSVFVWYLFEDSSKMFMYGNTYFKWIYCFLFMLLGAYVGNKSIMLVSRPTIDAILLIFSVLSFYAIQFFAVKSEIVAHLQIVSLIPLMGVVIYIYKLSCTEKCNRIMKSNAGFSLQFIAGLCLEAYIVQVTLIPYLSNYISSLFPLSLLIMFIIIIIAAYITRSIGNFISQVFEKDSFDWKSIFALIK